MLWHVSTIQGYLQMQEYVIAFVRVFAPFNSVKFVKNIEWGNTDNSVTNPLHLKMILRDLNISWHNWVNPLLRDGTGTYKYQKTLKYI